MKTHRPRSVSFTVDFDFVKFDTIPLENLDYDKLREKVKQISGIDELIAQIDKAKKNTEGWENRKIEIEFDVPGWDGGVTGFVVTITGDRPLSKGELDVQRRKQEAIERKERKEYERLKKKFEK